MVNIKIIYLIYEYVGSDRSKFDKRMDL